MNFIIRTLTVDDSIDYQKIRLRSLLDHPESYGSSYEEESARSDKDINQMFIDFKDSKNFIIGAFSDKNNLIGILGVNREIKIKTRHKANIWGVYVIPEMRGKSIAKKLLLNAIDILRNDQYIRNLLLGVTITNEPAVRLYESLGFRTYGTEPDDILVNGRFHSMHLMCLKIKEGI